VTISFADRKAALARQIANGPSDGHTGAVGLNKSTSNLFRDRKRAPKRRLDASAFHHVLEVDSREGWVDVEGMTPYDALAAATLRSGAMPCVVPQLKSITIGGAVAGVGIEASSFRYGLVHDTLIELEILLGDGSIVVARPDNELSDLFFAFPNSYGTLGYALRVKTKTILVKPYVKLTHLRYRDANEYFRRLGEWCLAGDVDFVDGSVFGAEQLYVTLGRFVDEAPYTSDYTYENIYYRSIAQRESDYLTTEAYLWRWDTDWFWCSKNLGAQHPLVRRLLGRKRLNSRFYTKVMRWNSRWRLTHALDCISGLHRESVIQDVDVPIEHAAQFLDFFQREIGISPVWICPIGAPHPARRWTLYPLDRSKLYVNFGFWDVVRAERARPPGYYNRLVEQKVQELQGIKSLYSDSFYPPAEFWATYDGEVYQALKRKYDPGGVFKDLYQKCVLRQ